MKTSNHGKYWVLDKFEEKVEEVLRNESFNSDIIAEWEVNNIKISFQDKNICIVSSFKTRDHFYFKEFKKKIVQRKKNSIFGEFLRRKFFVFSMV